MFLKQEILHMLVQVSREERSLAGTVQVFRKGNASGKCLWQLGFQSLKCHMLLKVLQGYTSLYYYSTDFQK